MASPPDRAALHAELATHLARIAESNTICASIQAQLAVLDGAPAPAQPAQRIVLLKEAARQIGRSPDTVQRYAARCGCGWRVGGRGGRWMIDLDALEAFVRERA